MTHGLLVFVRASMRQALPRLPVWAFSLLMGLTRKWKWKSVRTWFQLLPPPLL